MRANWIEIEQPRNAHYTFVQLNYTILWFNIHSFCFCRFQFLIVLHGCESEMSNNVNKFSFFLFTSSLSLHMCVDIFLFLLLFSGNNNISECIAYRRYCEAPENIIWLLSWCRHATTTITYSRNSYWMNCRSNGTNYGWRRRDSAALEFDATYCCAAWRASTIKWQKWKEFTQDVLYISNWSRACVM